MARKDDTVKDLDQNGMLSSEGWREHVKQYERFIETHPTVKEWLNNRPRETRRKFAQHLIQFCNYMNIDPEEWRNLDKFEARDLAWKFVSKKAEKHPSTAKVILVALKSFYRNKQGEQLPLDSGRGGKHYLPTRHVKRSFEHIPNKQEMYQIVDMTSSLRDKTILLLLFQSGVRVNVIEHLTYGDVEDHLDEEIITLKITPRLDYKLRGRNIPFYYTFLNGEGAETLRRYCQVHHKGSEGDTPLFYTRQGNPVHQRWVWKVVKMCAERTGLDPKTIWTHTIRKAFRKIVRQAPIDDDDKEQLMGHVIPGSREAYFDRKDVDLIKEAYQKCNFTREIPESNHVRMKSEIQQLQAQNVRLAGMVEELRRELAAMKDELKALKRG